MNLEIKELDIITNDAIKIQITNFLQFFFS